MNKLAKLINDLSVKDARLLFKDVQTQNIE